MNEYIQIKSLVMVLSQASHPWLIRHDSSSTYKASLFLVSFNLSLNLLHLMLNSECQLPLFIASIIIHYIELKRLIYEIGICSYKNLINWRDHGSIHIWINIDMLLLSLALLANSWHYGKSTCLVLQEVYVCCS
jgi:hypothetical protein